MSLPFTLTNDGNYLEDLTMVTQVDSGGVQLDTRPRSNSTSTKAVGTLTVDAPALGGWLTSTGDDEVLIYVNDTATARSGPSAGCRQRALVRHQQSRLAKILPSKGLSQGISANVRNVGNADIDVNVEVALYRLRTPSSRTTGP